MRNAIILLTGILFLNIFFSSCNRTKRGVGPVEVKSMQVTGFSKVTLEIPADLTIVIADSFNCVITAQSNIIEVVKVNVSGNELTISSDYSFDDSKIEMVISLPGVTALGISGSGNIKTLNVIKSEKLKLNIDGSGEMDIHAETDELRSRINGSGSCNLKGSTKSLNVDINGSGDLHGFQLSSIDAEVELNGSGDAEILATDELNATVKGSGNIIYKGSPHLNSEITGSGNIKKSEE